MNKFEKRQIEQVRHAIGRTINEYSLIKDGDHILVGLSGGKDSLILLETLAVRRKYIPIHYKLTAVHVNIKNMPYEVNIDFLRNFCETLSVDFLVKEVEYKEDGNKSPCYFCSWSRRKIFFATARELDIKKIATGHHLDDALETLFMNMVYHASMSSLPASFEMFDGEMLFIRPMIEIPEKKLVEYAEIRKFPKVKSKCPHDQITKRKRMRSFIDSLEDEHASAKKNMFNAMSKIIPEYLPGKDHIVKDTKLRKE